MKTGSQRTCDVCGQAIPPRTGFHQVRLRPEAVRIFLGLADAELEPNWRIAKDGSGQVELDICQQCRAGMGTPPLES